jgi:hypothetical protein
MTGDGRLDAGMGGLAGEDAASPTCGGDGFPSFVPSRDSAGIFWANRRPADEHVSGNQSGGSVMTTACSKVTASHLQRNAYLYVRQSTLRQVFENTESTQRQYALREKAATLGWLYTKRAPLELAAEKPQNF